MRMDERRKRGHPIGVGKPLVDHLVESVHFLKV